MQKICKGGEAWANLGNLKKRGTQLQPALGEALEDNVVPPQHIKQN